MRPLGAIGRWWEHARTSPIVSGTIAALLAIAISAVLPPDKLAQGALDRVGGIFRSEPSAAERAVDSLFASIEGDPFWRSTPVMSSASREFLIANWSQLNPGEVRPMPSLTARWRTLEEVFENHSLDGHRLFLTVFVDQITNLEDLPDRPDRIRESFRIMSPVRDQVGWCSDIVLPRGKALSEDQMITLMATPVARGSALSPDGKVVDTTRFVCSAVHPLVDAEASRDVAYIFHAQETDKMWSDPPSMSEEGRMFLLRHWEQLSPYEVHTFPSRPPRYLRLDRIYYDNRFDYGRIWVAGVVMQRHLLSAGTGLVREQVRLELDGQATTAWCESTLQSWRLFEEGDYVEAIAVPIARGSTPFSSGGFKNQTFLACPAMRVVAGS
jgi:hypothetical protein